MGINPTPTNHRAFTFDGKSTREFGVYITGEGVFNAPERAVEMISIPGRDGEYALDQGHFNNIEVTYRAGIVSDSTIDFAEAISNFRNWLASRKGYCRLTDEYNPDEYRMAVFKNAIALEHEGLLTGEFDVTFDCKPQRWLTSGETAVAVTSGGTITNPTLFDSNPLLAVEGYGEIKFNNRSIVDIESGQLGNITIANNISASSIQIDESLFNIGDTVTVSGAYQDLIINLQTDGTYYNIVRESESITDSNSDFSTAFFKDSPGTGQLPSEITYRITIPSFNITIGTDKTITDVVSGTISCKAKTPSANTFTATFTTTREFKYKASTNTITDTGYYSTVTTTAAYVTNAFVSTRQTYYGSVVGNSTVSRLGNPTYIDCDIGEAYMIKDGEPVSLNQYIDLGSDLPTLPPGDTEVTYDNTITKVEVKPNWWKV